MAEMAYYVCDVERVCDGSSGGVAEGGGLRKGEHGYPLVPSTTLIPGDHCGSVSRVCQVVVW
jgi:hypothetical protein